MSSGVMSPEEKDHVLANLERLDTIEVSRDRLAVAIRNLIAQIPTMLTDSGDKLPIYMRMATPALRMFLASEDIEKALSSDSLVDFVWGALIQCQNQDE